MPRFSANLSMLFGEHDFLHRFDAAAHAGFQGVEYIAPYDHEAETVAAKLKKNGGITEPWPLFSAAIA